MASGTQRRQKPARDRQRYLDDLAVPISTDEEILSVEFPEYTEDQITASICCSSFADFLKEFWNIVVPERLTWNWHMQVLCDELQKMGERIIAGEPAEYDLVINISPGTSKSTIASIMFPAWLWTRMPSCRILSASYAHQLSSTLSRKSRDVIKSAKYRRMFPGLDIRDDQDSKGYYVNTSGGERFAVGVDGGVFGQHAHVIIVDDPLNPQQASSDTELQACNDWMEETLPSRKVDKLNTPIILIMQRLHENDPAGRMTARGDDGNPVRVVCLPAELTDDVQPPELRDYYIDGLMDPKRLGQKALEKARKQGEAVFSCQYLQVPHPKGGAMFKVKLLTISIFKSKTVRMIRFWDKAATHGGGAFTAGVKMAADDEDRFWVLDVVRGQWDSGTREKKIKEVAALDGFKCTIGIEQEPGSGGKESAENTVRALAGYVVRKQKVGKSEGDKVARADAFSCQVNVGNVYLVPGLWNDDYVKELRFFPRSRYKDQVDASSGAFACIASNVVRIGGGTPSIRYRKVLM